MQGRPGQPRNDGPEVLFRGYGHLVSADEAEPGRHDEVALGVQLTVWAVLPVNTRLSQGCRKHSGTTGWRCHLPGSPELIDLLSLVAGERTSGMPRSGLAVMRDANPGR